MKIAILTDLHFISSPDTSELGCDYADILLARAVRRLNRFIKPQVTVILGDVLQDSNSSDAPELRARLEPLLAGLESPFIIIPGNHDGDADVFYREFPRLPEMLDINGVRFLPFLDREEPGYNASRSHEDLARLRASRNNFVGPIVCLQHVNLFPPGSFPADTHETWYNYTNAEDVIAAMKEAGVTLSISGHNHPGLNDVRRDGITFVNAPSMCWERLPFLLVTLDGDRVSTECQYLAVPKELELIDWHVHSPFAYCGEGLDFDRVIELAETFNLGGLGFSEHSGQLYFSADRYWSGHWTDAGMDDARESENRMTAYLKTANRYASDRVRIGLEVDCDFRGRVLLRPSDRKHVQFLMGSIHRLPDQNDQEISIKKRCEQFLTILKTFLKNDLDIIAHPLRIFSGWKEPLPKPVLEAIVGLLIKSDTAAEINFHNDCPPIEFVKLCLDAGVRLTLGSDTHSLCALGDLAPHLQLLKDAGFNGDLRDVLLEFPARDTRRV